MDISTGDDVVSLVPFSENFLKETVLLYNSIDMRYATGFKDELSEDQLALVLDQLRSRECEFASCIFTSGASDISRFVGIVSGVLQGNELWIKLLAVLPPFRNTGIGTRVVNLISRYFVEKFNVISAFVSVVEENAQGLRFWTRHGFSATGRIYKALFGEDRKYKVAIMNKRL